ncbi:MAG: MFS transporter [Cyanobacteria bacterium DS2.3.42]|nr:MFS transporter [Cyanobacteria bacterium DS2.3.42]
MSTAGLSQKQLLILLGAIPALGGLLVGYNTAVVAGALEFIAKDFSLKTVGQELVVTSILVGALIGAFLSGPLTDKLGQRLVIQLAGLICLVGAIGCALSPNETTLIIFRGLLGIACGVATMVAPLYVAETAPAKWRGAFVSAVQLAITAGIFLSYCTDYLLSPAGNWKAMMGIGAIPGAGLIAGMLLLPESPRWLAVNGKLDEARIVLEKLGNKEAEDEIVSISENKGETAAWSELFSEKVRPAAITASGLFLVQNLSGIDGVLYYAPAIFKLVGFEGTSAQILATAGLGAVNVIATIVATGFIDKAGRRPLLLGGLCVMVVSLAILSATLMFAGSAPWVSAVAATSLALFVAAFAVSLGPIPYVIMSEIFPQRVRSMGMSLAAASAWGCNMVVTVSFLSMMEMMGQANLFWLYCAICLAGLVFSYLRVPETNNCSLEDIEKNLMEGVPSRYLGKK